MQNLQLTVNFAWGLLATNLPRSHSDKLARASYHTGSLVPSQLSICPRWRIFGCVHRSRKFYGFILNRAMPDATSIMLSSVFGYTGLVWTGPSVAIVPSRAEKVLARAAGRRGASGHRQPRVYTCVCMCVCIDGNIDVNIQTYSLTCCG